MANSLKKLNLLPILILLFTTATAAISGSSAPSLPPSTTTFHPQLHTYSPALFATILSTLGFQELSTATASANLTATTPITVFAPYDASIIACTTCSLPQLLQELSLPGLYPIHFLRNLIFGTKIETLAPNRCLTITSTENEKKIFVNGVEITQPDLFNNGHVIIHGVQGFITHLSPISCNVERMTSLSFPPPAISSEAHSPSVPIVRLMLKDAILRLRTAGYGVVSLAMIVKYLDLSELKAMTIFALDDVSIFSGGGNAYLSNFRYHVVPNRRLTAAELVSLPQTTSLPTMNAGEYLVVTNAGGGGALAPMKINYVRITTIDLLHNSRIVVHGVSSPFPHMRSHFQQPFDEKEESEIGRSRCDRFDWERGICTVEAEVPAGIAPAVGGGVDRDGF